MAELYHRDMRLALWMLFAVSGGVAVLSGADSNGWRTDPVKAALDQVLEQAEKHTAWDEGIAFPE